jgi:hypothetical protein
VTDVLAAGDADRPGELAAEQRHDNSPYRTTKLYRTTIADDVPFGTVLAEVFLGT